MKRQRTEDLYSDTQLTQLDSYDMPSYASSRSRSKFGGKWRRKSFKSKGRIARSFPASNSIIISRVVDYDASISSGAIGKGFGFSPAALWVDGASSTAVPGAAEISALFDLVRIQKVEVTVMPVANTHTTNSSIGPGLLVLYCAYDPNDSTAPTLATIRENNTTSVTCLDKVFKRTIYPQLTVGSQLQTDIGVNRKNIFVQSAVDVAWNGLKLFLDASASISNGGARYSFKIFYECRNTV